MCAHDWLDFNARSAEPLSPMVDAFHLDSRSNTSWKERWLAVDYSVDISGGNEWALWIKTIAFGGTFAW